MLDRIARSYIAKHGEEAFSLKRDQDPRLKKW